MQTFAFIVLIALLIALTHTHNYVLRLVFRQAGNDAPIFMFVFSVIYGAVGFLLIKYIILWGYPLFA